MLGDTDAGGVGAGTGQAATVVPRTVSWSNVDVAGDGGVLGSDVTQKSNKTLRRGRVGCGGGVGHHNQVGLRHVQGGFCRADC